MNRVFALKYCSPLLASMLLTAASALAQQFPYTAYVTGEQTYARSGPGQRYYPTASLQPGFAVEVYRHGDNGWCAIRPPAGSFSWVPSHQVRAHGPGVVEIIADRVVTRVGSEVSPSKSAVQVLLPKGELVQLLAAHESDDPNWVRVAAPAGEFRWIAASALSRQPPMEVTPTPSDQSTGTVTGTGWQRQTERTLQPADESPSVFDHLQAQTNTQPSGLRFGAPQPIPMQSAPQQSAAIESSADPNQMQIIAGSPAELQLTQYQLQSPTVPATPPALLGESVSAPHAASSTVTAGQPRVRFDGLSTAAPIQVSSVEELELRLSQTVVRPPQEWQLAPLEKTAAALLVATKTPSVRAQLREVGQRIARFKEVQQRYNNPAPPLATSVPRQPVVRVETESSPTFTGQTADVRERVKQDLQSNSDPFEETESTGNNAPLYAAAGTLKPVISKRESAPQYALVDERGKVVSFVTPTPDLNLKPFVGRRIGVHGSRGYMPEYRRAHVTAGRVTPIDGIIRR